MTGMKSWLVIVTLAGALGSMSAARPPDVPFRIHMIDSGASETAAVADINHDGRPDIVSGDNWYESPSWTPHAFREINFTSNYVDNFSDDQNFRNSSSDSNFGGFLRLQANFGG